VPTYGFIHETVEDRRHEHGAGPPAPVCLDCPLCGELCDGELALARHLGDAHPLTAPRLLVGGEALTGERVLHRNPTQLAVANATELLVACDGGVASPWSVAALQDFVAEARQALLDVTLHNRRAADAACASEHMRLRLDVPDDAELDGVDAVFIALAALDEQAADGFADAAREFNSAQRYAAALHEYLIGVLIKDRSLVQPFDRYHGKFQRALEVLRHFPERPVARAVVGFVRFDSNVFAGPCGVPELDRCAARLAVLGGRAAEEPALSGSVAGACPAAESTAAILAAWDRRDVPALLARADAAETTPADTAKCRALALDITGAFPIGEELVRAARGLSGDLVFGPWAAAIIEDAAT
jgi:hypothetical protein